MEQKLLDVLYMVYTQDFSGVNWDQKAEIDAALVELEEKHLLKLERVNSGCGGCTGCGVQIFPEIIDAGVAILKQEGMIKEEEK